MTDKLRATNASLLRDPWAWFLIALLKRATYGSLTIQLRDGTVIPIVGREPGPKASVTICHRRWAKKILTRGSMGIAESYVDGDWECDDLAAFIEYCVINRGGAGWKMPRIAPVKMMGKIQHKLRANTRHGSRRNIAHHYDLGNDFYEAWLDSSMTYSAGIFDNDNQTLEQSQEAKYRRICEELNLKPDQRVLEIGCGWGGFAEFAAKNYGCSIDAITISQAQHDFAQRRMADAGLSNRVSIELRDYRDVTGRYDKIVSIEMIEAVGAENWQTYFAKIRDLLTSGGTAVIQAITIADRLYDDYRRTQDFIQKYIFPGGMLPCPSALTEIAESTGLKTADWYNFGGSYARTLALWRRRFLDGWPDIQKTGFDERFRRMWIMYLCYCEGGFRGKSVDVAQIRLVRA